MLKYRIDLPRCAVRDCGKMADLSLDRQITDYFVCRDHLPLREFARRVLYGEKGDWLADVTPFPMPMHTWLMSSSRAKPFRPISWHRELAELLGALGVTIEEEKERRR